MYSLPFPVTVESGFRVHRRTWTLRLSVVTDSTPGPPSRRLPQGPLLHSSPRNPGPPSRRQPVHQGLPLLAPAQAARTRNGLLPRMRLRPRESLQAFKCRDLMPTRISSRPRRPLRLGKPRVEVRWMLHHLVETALSSTAAKLNFD